MPRYQFVEGDHITTRRQVGAIVAGTLGAIERVYPTARNVYKVAFDHHRTSEVLLGDDIEPVDRVERRDARRTVRPSDRL